MSYDTTDVEKASALLRRLSLDLHVNDTESSDALEKKPSVNQYSFADGEISNSSSPSLGPSTSRTRESSVDPSLYYLSSEISSATYCHGGYDGPMNECLEYRTNVNPDGMGLPPPGFYGDIGSYAYQHGRIRSPHEAYSPVSHVPTISINSQSILPQHYPYAALYYSPQTPSDATYTQHQVPPSQVKAINATYGRRMQPAGDGPFFSDGYHRTMPNNSASTSISPPRNQNLYPSQHLMGMHRRPPSNPASLGFVNSSYRNKLYDHLGNMVRPGPSFASRGFDYKTNRQGLMADGSKYMRWNRSNENVDGLKELSTGPRASQFQNPMGILPNFTTAAEVQNFTSNGKNDSNSNVILNSDQYNRADFPIWYLDAKFFIIKSFGEDHIHRSIKYSVWTSTPFGNKKLDAAYREAQDKIEQCPVFLIFSVNLSRQFVGLAEMCGPVDFNKKLQHWKQDTWTGCFPVTWHIVKDLPNNLLKHIILENNDNMPITCSKDTQEVKLEQGLEVLKIFKNHIGKSCMLDDFSFYDHRENLMQARKVKLHPSQKQVPDGKLVAIPVSDKGKGKSCSHPMLEEAYLSEPTNIEACQDSRQNVIHKEISLVADAGEDGSNGLKMSTEDP